ncbi:hypothetical protein B296_00015614 [Ensete ventricosum]|uniref:BRCT domain-containing protein n=1 Tax=Ensete ventricosum TaxID=4639 RepID=A0A426Z758_ENSVE|nr:hypothetical protein B296_00015614 [Ensete ventricosum]
MVEDVEATSSQNISSSNISSSFSDATKLKNEGTDSAAVQLKDEKILDSHVAEDSESDDNDLYLSNCRILLVGFEEMKLNRLVTMIRNGGGTRHMLLNEKLTHIITGEPSDTYLVFSNFYQRAQVIEWVGEGGGMIVDNHHKMNANFIIERHGLLHVPAGASQTTVVSTQWIRSCLENMMVAVDPFRPKPVTAEDREAGICTVSQYPTQAACMIYGCVPSQLPSEFRELNVNTTRKTGEFLVQIADLVVQDCLYIV